MSIARIQAVEDVTAEAGHRVAASPSDDAGQSVDDRSPERMTPEHRNAVALARAEIARGDVAGDDEIEAAFRRFRP